MATASSFVAFISSLPCHPEINKGDNDEPEFWVLKRSKAQLSPIKRRVNEVHPRS
jgi:hypothetical protein